MGVTIGVKLEGADKLTKALGDMQGRLSNALGDGIKRAAFLIERYSKQYTPVDTGRLRASIYTSLGGDTFFKGGKAVGSLLEPTQSIYVTTATNYAVYVHRRIPFMTAGLYEASGEIRGTFEAEIEQALETIK